MFRRIIRPRHTCAARGGCANLSAGWLLVVPAECMIAAMYELEIGSESTVHACCFCGIPEVFREQCVPVKFPGCWFAQEDPYFGRKSE